MTDKKATFHEWKEQSCGCGACLDANCLTHNKCYHVDTKPLTSEERAEYIFNDLNGRSGIHLDSIDEEFQVEIKVMIAAQIEDAKREAVVEAGVENFSLRAAIDASIKSAFQEGFSAAIEKAKGMFTGTKAIGYKGPKMIRYSEVAERISKMQSDTWYKWKSEDALRRIEELGRRNRETFDR